MSSFGLGRRPYERHQVKAVFWSKLHIPEMILRRCLSVSFWWEWETHFLMESFPRASPHKVFGLASAISFEDFHRQWDSFCKCNWSNLVQTGFLLFLILSEAQVCLLVYIYWRNGHFFIIGLFSEEIVLSGIVISVYCYWCLVLCDILLLISYLATSMSSFHWPCLLKF